MWAAADTGFKITFANPEMGGQCAGWAHKAQPVLLIIQLFLFDFQCNLMHLL